MKTPIDVMSLILFAGLAILFLQRSASNESDPVALWKYALAAIGCAAGDILGNAGQTVAGWVVLAAAAVFSFVTLKPFQFPSKS